MSIEERDTQLLRIKRVSLNSRMIDILALVDRGGITDREQKITEGEACRSHTKRDFTVKLQEQSEQFCTLI